MTRRALLGMLAAALVDPDRLVWVPDRKIISIPRRRAVVYNWSRWGFYEESPKLQNHVFCLFDYLDHEYFVRPVADAVRPPFSLGGHQKTVLEYHNQARQIYAGLYGQLLRDGKCAPAAEVSGGPDGCSYTRVYIP